jgi:16S rRNA (cytidine1402-2'-O)-methyltransferase
VRELTKLRGEVIRATVADVAALLADREVLGEIVVVLEGASEAPPQASDEVIVAALFEQWDDGATTRDAVEYVTEALGASRRDVYRLALEARKDESSS